ncbi:MAG: M56 family metallopeptidase [Methylococcales bacterium]|jgi:beta-lactamase regulating signal transducer with metallopeptidase domain|nr:M56 family metallopeptidase [Methylococcales bacterium]MBT7408505.1 M56 family metallopeptidase [Methylococcales bacterium]
MIVGQWGIILNVMTMAIIAMLVAIGTTSLLLTIILNKSVDELQLEARKQLLWFMVSTPWIIALTTAVLYYVIFIFEYDHYLSPLVSHWHHMAIFQIQSWHGFSLILFSIMIVSVLGKKITLVYRSSQQLSVLQSLSIKQKDGSYLIESNVINAFTCGLLKPVCYLTSALKAGLNKEELSMVQIHENAHIKSYDPIKKLLFQLLSSFYPVYIRKTLLVKFSIVMEQMADRQVVLSGYDNHQVASTLVKVARGNLSQNKLSPLIAVNFYADALEARVRYLMSDQGERKNSHFIILSSLTCLLLLSVFSVDSLYHLIEHILNH